MLPLRRLLWNSAALTPTKFIQKRNLSYIERVRFQQLLKEDDNECTKSLCNGQFLLYDSGKPLMGKGFVNWTDFDTAKALNENLERESVFMQIAENGQPLFAAPIPDNTSETAESTLNGKFMQMRVAMFLVDWKTSHQLTQGWCLLQWNRKTGFCANCGHAVERNSSGTRRTCSNCSSIHYPSTSPVGIVLIAATDNSKALLIRQPRYPPGMYSCLAGFLDVGETLEDCVRREAAEEAGIEIERVEFHSSQYWPFPAGALMNGCFALASPDAVPSPCPNELEDARWFAPEELRRMVDRITENPHLRVGKGSDELFVPPPTAIAHHLIKGWLEKYGN